MKKLNIIEQAIEDSEKRNPEDWEIIRAAAKRLKL